MASQDITLNGNWTSDQSTNLGNPFVQLQQGHPLNKKRKYLQILAELVHLIYILENFGFHIFTLLNLRIFFVF